MTTARISRSHIVGLTCIPIAGALLNGFYNGPLYRLNPSLFWAADFLLYVLAPVTIVIVLAQFAQIYPKHFGLKIPPFGGIEAIATSIFLAFVLLATYEVVKYFGWVFTYRWYSAPDFSYGAATPNGVLRPLVVFYWAITAGLMESIFYIGLPWHLWRNQFGLAERRRTFLWLSSIVFAAVHWEQGPHNVVAAFAFGLVACLLYWKINDLWPIVGAHTLVDIALFL
jgi:membrane protease YdiL (CAAX protease family)